MVCFGMSRLLRLQMARFPHYSALQRSILRIQITVVPPTCSFSRCRTPAGDFGLISGVCNPDDTTQRSCIGSCAQQPPSIPQSASNAPVSLANVQPDKPTNQCTGLAQIVGLARSPSGRRSRGCRVPSVRASIFVQLCLRESAQWPWQRVS